MPDDPTTPSTEAAPQVPPVNAADVKRAWKRGMGEWARRSEALSREVDQTTDGRRETFHVSSAGGISLFGGLTNTEQNGALASAAQSALRQPVERKKE